MPITETASFQFGSIFIVIALVLLLFGTKEAGIFQLMRGNLPTYRGSGIFMVVAVIWACAVFLVSLGVGLLVYAYINS